MLALHAANATSSIYGQPAARLPISRNLEFPPTALFDCWVFWDNACIVGSIMQASSMFVLADRQHKISIIQKMTL